MYRGSLFLPSKRVEASLRTVFAKSVMRGHVNGKLGQMHLDVLEACFSNQLHFATSNQTLEFVNADSTKQEKSVNVTGIVFDPYQVRKSLAGRIKNDRIYLYIEEIMSTKLQVAFTPPGANTTVMANTPMIVGFENFKEIPSKHFGKSRQLKCIYFPPWYVDLCKLTPHFDHKTTFFGIKDPREQAIARYLSTHENDFVLNLSDSAICSLLDIGVNKETTLLVSKNRKHML